MTIESFLETSKDLLETLGKRAYAPYSKIEQACIFLFEDGSWIPGVRVENASYPLTITAFQNAWASSLSADAIKTKPIALVFNHTPNETELQIAKSIYPNLEIKEETLLLDKGRHDLPMMETTPYSLELGLDKSSTEKELMRTCKNNASHAVIAESNFPVSSLVITASSKIFLGTNVESSYWPLTLCAERNALSTAMSYGHSDFTKLLLTCPKDLAASPCGACRQVICELATDAEIIMDRGHKEFERTTPVGLLPGPFLGENLRK